VQRELSIPKIVFALAIGLYLLKCILSPATYHFIDSINLIFHEAGHSLLNFGDLVTATAGSLFQVLIPALCGVYFLARREYYSAMIIFMWMGQSLVNVSLYVGDAIAMQLPLLGGDGAMHDWNYALSVTNLIPYTAKIARGIYICGISVFAFASFFSFRLAYGESKAKAAPKYDWMAK
jgi:hypothetical protein